MDALLCVAAFLRAEHQHLPSAKARHAANHGGIVTKTAVSVNFAEIGKDALNVIQRIRTHRVACKFGTFPRRELASYLTPQRVHPDVHFLQLAAGFLVVAGSAL